ncbi:MAG TPA: hypothetical protein DCX07_03100 [Phycisphaerales bacterium]|nr:hypothetical protein [Phycisphaerales bacterium]
MHSIEDSEHQQDLRLAAELQAALLPTECPADCPHQLAAAKNRMCGSVGGDFLDFIRINEDQTAVVIGDVIGHGVRASLLMAKIMGVLRSRPPALARPAEMVASLNEMLIDLGNRVGGVMPCTMFYAVLDLPTGVSFFVNAGHSSPFLVERPERSIQHLGFHDLLLGVEKYTPNEGCITFTPGQRLVLYTDGVCDAANPQNHRFGEKRLRELIAAGSDLSPQELATTVFATVDAFRRGAAQVDDETIVVIDRV